MLGRRTFSALVTGVSMLPRAVLAQREGANMAFYASIGPELSVYTVDAADLSLTRDSAVTVPANIQYAAQHPSRRFLYVASSNRSTADDQHHVTVFRIEAGSGRLTQHDAPTALRSRPIHITADPSGAFLLTAYNAPSSLSVHRIERDGAVGPEIPQQGLDWGVYAHQVRVAPGGKTVLLVARGNDPTAAKAEDPGAIKVFDFADGRLTQRQSVAPDGGVGFGPRHVDFSRDGQFVYVSVERQNALHTFALRDGSLSDAPLFQTTTLAQPSNTRPGQLAGPIHVSEDGRFVYVANRSDGTADFNGRKVWVGGENSIAVFAIDPSTGEPRHVQSADPRSFHVRTFSLSPAASMLVTAAVLPLAVREGGQVRIAPAALTVFRIADGRLSEVRKYDVDTAKGPLFWCAMLPL